MAGPRLDDSQFPLVITTWPDGAIDDAALDAWLERSMETWSRGRQLALHLGMRATGMTSVQRKRVGDFAKQHEKRLAEIVIATAIVADSAIVRGVVTAINWVAPPPFPQRVFAKRVDAEAWLRGQLDAGASAARAG